MTTITMDLREFVTGRAHLNRALNVIEGTVLITSHSVNGGKGGRRYSGNALKQIAAMAEGLPAYLNHVSPDLAFKPRDVKDLIGVHRNIRYFPNEGRVMSDLHVAEHHAPLMFGLAETLGGVIGNSLVSRGAVRREGDVEIVEDIVLLRSADLVSDPATTKGLFEARQAVESQDLDEVHERLRCAITGEPYFPPAERAKIDAMAEAWRRGEPITDVLAEARDPLPENIHQRLAVALGLAEARDPLPEDVARRVSEIIREAVTGGPALPDGIEARLARAL